MTGNAELANSQQVILYFKQLKFSKIKEKDLIWCYNMSIKTPKDDLSRRN